VDILVLHPGALGDIILSLPALGILREHFPGASVTLAGNTDHLAVVSRDYADRLLPLATVPLHCLFAGDAIQTRDRNFWVSFERVLSWTGAGDPEFRGRLQSFNPRALVAAWRPSAAEARHVSRIFVDSLRPWLGAHQAIPLPAISARPEDRRNAGDRIRRQGWEAGHPTAALHVGAGAAAKRWPLAHFREIARRLRRAGNQVLVIEGPAEPGAAATLQSDLPGSGIITAESLPLGMVAGLLSHCEVFAGNDSGIAHLAAGLGIPSLVLFGPTSPKQWAPLGRSVETIYAPDGLPGLTVETVWSALAPLLA